MSASIWNPSTPSGATAAVIPFTPTTTLAATNVQAAIEETDSENRQLLATFKSEIAVSVKDFGAVGDGTTDDTLAITAAITSERTNKKGLFFPPGTYKISSTIDFVTNADRDLRYIALGKVTIYNTGSGPVVSLDAGSGGARADNILFDGFILKGNSFSSYGLYTRGLCRSKVRARAYDVATAGFRTEFSVLTNYDLTVSNNIDTFSVIPITGLSIDQSGVGNYCADNKYHAVMEAPISSIGVDYITGGLGNIFTGTCEGVPTGFRQRSGASDCILLGMDFEANTVQDVLIEGTRLTMLGCNAQSNGSSSCINIASTAIGPTILTGYAVAIDIDSAATGVNICQMHLNDNVALGIKGTGSVNWRGTGNNKVNSSRVITAAIPDQSGVRGSYTATLTGCTTSPSSSIDYRVDGDVVTLNISSITATSNSTSATITGMPAAICPSTTRSDVGVATDNAANVVARFEIDSSGVITLRNGASAVFTAAGTKGVQASTIVYKL